MPVVALIISIVGLTIAIASGAPWVIAFCGAVFAVNLACFAAWLFLR